MNRIIAHIDMDAFFASIEQNDKPWLKGKAVGVTGNPQGRSVIATASYEARAFGVKSGMPLSLAKKLCPHIILIKSNFERYEGVSDRLFDLFSGYAPLVERFSIDEVFMDLTYKSRSYEEALSLCRTIKDAVKSNFNITCSIGVSFNKLLAKLASKLSKPDGLMLIKEENAQEVIKSLSVNKITGIGKKTALLLKDKFNVESVGDLQKISFRELVDTFGVYGKFLYNASRGIDDSPVISPVELEDAKSIGNSMTFDIDTDDINYIDGMIRLLSSKVSHRLREDGFLCSCVVVTVRYSNFITKKHQKRIDFTNLDSVIYATALNLFKEVYEGGKVRLVGVGVSHLTRKDSNNLFEGASCSKEEKALLAMDTLRRKFGFNAIEYGSAKLPKEDPLRTSLNFLTRDKGNHNPRNDGSGN